MGKWRCSKEGEGDKSEANLFPAGRGRGSPAKTLKILYPSTMKEEQFILFTAKWKYLSQ